MEKENRRHSVTSLPAVAPAKATNSDQSFPIPASGKYPAGNSRKHYSDYSTRSGMNGAKPLKRAKSLQPIRHSRKDVEQEINNILPPLPNGIYVRSNITLLGAVPAPLPENEDKRLQVLHDYNVLDTEPEPVFDDITLLASHICNVPVALISLVDEGRQWFKSKIGVEVDETGRNEAFCAHAILTPNDIFEVPNALEDERFKKNPLVVSGPKIRFYAGSPLVADDVALGTLCVIDKRPRKLNAQQSKAIAALSRIVVDQLDLRKRNEELRELILEREKSRKQIELLNRQLRADNEHLRIQLQEEKTKFVLDTPAESVIETLQNIKGFLNSHPQQQREIDGVIDIIGAHKLYTVDINTSLESEKAMDNDTKLYLISQLSTEFPSAPQSTVPSTSPSDEGSIFSLEDHKDALQGLDSWDFDMFDLNTRTQGHALMYTAVSLFDSYGLFDAAFLDRTKFISFVQAIERGYQDNPYHNSTHAADVLQTCNVFVAGHMKRSYLSTKEIAALFLAAIVHDYKHPGLNNTFLIKTNHDLAITYNDISVLESYHCSQAFHLLKDPQLNFMANVPATDYAEFRKIVVQLVLATDLSRHLPILNEFHDKVAIGLNMQSAEDRLLAMKMCIKCADMSNVAKNPQLCHMWTDRVMEEFYRQGDEEKKMQLPISAFMDRENPAVDKCQIGFITYICMPAFKPWTEMTQMKFVMDNIHSNLRRWMQ